MEILFGHKYLSFFCFYYTVNFPFIKNIILKMEILLGHFYLSFICFYDVVSSTFVKNKVI